MKKRIMAAVVLAVMTMTTGASVFATTISEGDVTTNPQAECEITAHKNSEFTVTLPKTISLNDVITDGIVDGNYEVKVKGDIAGYETITVTPVASFDMVEAAHKKANVPVTVTQEKTNFIFSDISGENGVSTGHLTTSQKLTAGDWTGTMSFTIAVVREPGLYDADGNKLCSWEESGINIEKDYSSTSSDTNYYETDRTSGYYVLTNNYPTATAVVIPEGTISIGNGAFASCTSITSVTIPSSVTSIGDGAFGGCTSLTNITISSSVTSIGKWAFDGCTSLSSTTFETTEGWYVGDSAGAKTTVLSSSDLANASTAATYLKSDYINKYWTRQP